MKPWPDWALWMLFVLCLTVEIYLARLFGLLT